VQNVSAPPVYAKAEPEAIIHEVPKMPEEEEEKSAKCKVQSAKCDVQNAKIESTLLEVVSQLTGYPTDMLSFDMDIESDLGQPINRLSGRHAFL